MSGLLHGSQNSHLLAGLPGIGPKSGRADGTGRLREQEDKEYKGGPYQVICEALTKAVGEVDGLAGAWPSPGQLLHAATTEGSRQRRACQATDCECASSRCQ